MHIRNLICCALVAASLITPGVASAQKKDQQSAAKTQPGQKTLQLGVPTSNHPVKGPGGMDKKFIQEATVGNLVEIQLGEMAEKKASDPSVKQFAGRMVKDHSASDDLLKGIAQSQQVGLPTGLTPQYKNQKSALAKQTGSQFDKDYMQTMVQDHVKAINQFKQEAAASQDPTVKKYAQDSLPTLESHLNEAKQVQSQLNGGKK